MRYQNVRVGTRVLDFLIEDRIILELKASSGFRKKDYEQVKDYLKTSNLPLALLARFGPEGVVFRRVLKP